MTLQLRSSSTHKRKGSFTTLETMSTCLSENNFDMHSETSSSRTTSRSSSPSRQNSSRSSSSVKPGILVVRTQQESLEKKYKTLRVIMLEDLPEQQRETTISFSKVHFREHERTMGVNPSVRDGVPLTLSWNVQNEFAWDLEAYEQSRPPRRERNELCIPADVRHQMMRDMGHSRDEILVYIKKANIARNQRNRTNHTTELAKAEEFTQKLVRGVLNKTIRSGKKKQEKKLLQEHLEKDRQMQTKYEEMRKVQLQQRLIET